MSGVGTRFAQANEGKQFAVFTVSLAGPYADEWVAESVRQEIMEAFGLTEQEVMVEKA